MKFVNKGPSQHRNENGLQSGLLDVNEQYANYMQKSNRTILDKTIKMIKWKRSYNTGVKSKKSEFSFDLLLV